MKLDAGYSEKLNNGKGDSKKKFYNENVEETLDNYLNIWQINPSFKDINNNIATLRALFLVLLTIFLIASFFYIGINLINSVGGGIIILLLFIVIFHENFFSIKDVFSYSFHKINKINPFESFLFFFKKQNPNILFFTNKTDLKTCALSIFQVKVIPENVHPTLNQFIKSLNETNIPYSYQVVQSPIFESTIIHKSNKNLKEKIRHQQNNSVMSFKTKSTDKKIDDLLPLELNINFLIKIKRKLRFRGSDALSDIGFGIGTGFIALKAVLPTWNLWYWPVIISYSIWIICKFVIKLWRG